MVGASERHVEQTALWNGAGGNAWAEMQGLMDRVLQPLEDLLVDAVGGGDGGRVLDVGCGAGGTTLAIARRLGAAGKCTGVDISEPLVTAARNRAERDGVRVQFVLADAQRHQFEPAAFDMIASRFGVMFFDDPVAAFTNLRTAVRDGGALRCIAWRSAAENPFMTTAERAAAPLVAIPPRESDGPGQFAFADAQRVRSILEQSGWDGIDVEPVDAACTFPEPDLVPYLTRLGPLGRALVDADASTVARVVEAVRPAFDAYVDGGSVHFTAACWMIGAHA